MNVYHTKYLHYVAVMDAIRTIYSERNYGHQLVCIDVYNHYTWIHNINQNISLNNLKNAILRAEKYFDNEGCYAIGIAYNTVAVGKRLKILYRTTDVNIISLYKATML